MLPPAPPSFIRRIVPLRPSPLPPPPEAAARLGARHTSGGQLHAILCVVGATLLFGIASVFVKLVSPPIPVMEVAFFRCIFSLLPLLPTMWRRHVRVFPVTSPGWHLARTVFGLVGMASSFYGVARLPLGDYTALCFVMPLVLTLLSVPFLGEKLGIRRVSAALVGFSGVLLIARPFGGEDALPLLPTLVVLGSTVTWSLSMVAIRRLGALGEQNLVIIFWFAIGASLVSFAAMLPVWVTPDPWQLGLLIGVGVVSAYAQIMVTEGYRAGETSVVAPFEYAAILWALLFGWLIWGERPEPSMLAGVAILIASGLYILHREVVRRRERERLAAGSH